MFRALIFCENKSDRERWQNHLGDQFETAVVTVDESLDAMLDSWRPHVLIYSEKNIETLVQTSIAAVVVVAKAFNLKHEVLAYENGADHYFLLNTPVDILRARLTQLARKINTIRKVDEIPVLPTISKVSGRIEYENVVVDIDQKLVKQNDEIVHLTPTQFRLLTAFLSHPEETLTREWLAEHAFHGKAISMRSIDAQIAKLKRTMPFLKTRLINLYGVGYILRSGREKVAA